MRSLIPAFSLLALLAAPLAASASGWGDFAYVVIDLKEAGELTSSVCSARDPAARAELSGRYQTWRRTNGPALDEIERQRSALIAAAVEGKDPAAKAEMATGLAAMVAHGILPMAQELAKQNDQQMLAYCRAAFANPETPDPQVRQFHAYFARAAAAKAEEKAACAKAIGEIERGGVADCPRYCECSPLSAEQMARLEEHRAAQERREAEQRHAALKETDRLLWAVERIKANCQDGLDEILRHKEWLNARARDDYGTTPLLAAVGANRFELAKRLLAAGADAKAANELGTSALIAAVRPDEYYVGRIETVCGRDAPTRPNLLERKAFATLLLQYGADPYQLGKNKLNAIEEAGHVDEGLKALLTQRAAARAVPAK